MNDRLLFDAIDQLLRCEHDGPGDSSPIIDHARQRDSSEHTVETCGKCGATRVRGRFISGAWERPEKVERVVRALRPLGTGRNVADEIRGVLEAAKEVVRSFGGPDEFARLSRSVDVLRGGAR